VHFQYGVTYGGGSAYTIEARSDVDGDRVLVIDEEFDES